MPGTFSLNDRRHRSRLHALRMRRGWSMEELARRAGVSPRTIYDAEVRGRQPHPATRAVLAAALGCEPDDLLKTLPVPTVADRRRELGIDRRTLALRAGIEERIVSAIEVGDCEPTRTEQEAIAAALQTSVDRIFCH